MCDRTRRWVCRLRRAAGAKCTALRCQPAAWEYPAGARVLKVDSEGKLTLAGKNWKISDALAGEWVQVLQLEQRLQAYYCTTLIREIDLGIQRSTMVERWIPS